MERRYCLCCADRPMFTNKVEAYLHARSAHPLLLRDGADPDELFEVRGGEPEPWVEERRDDQQGPWYCLGCETHVQRLVTMRDHWNSQHGLPRELCAFGTHYVDEEEKIRRKGEADRERERQIEAFGRRMRSLVGVSDFLFECRP